MPHEPTEDVPYSQIDDFAIAEDDTDVDSEQTDQVINSELYKEILKYLDEAILEHNSNDIIDLTEQAKMTPTQQIAMHKCVVQHLRSIKNVIKDKREES